MNEISSVSTSTYNQTVKNEIIASKLQKKCCRDALLYGMLISSNRFEKSEIKLITENKGIADLCYSLLLGITESDRLNYEASGGKRPEYRIRVASGTDTVLSHFCELNDVPNKADFSTYRINKAILKCDDCKACFIRGVFLACGNVLSPKKSYHMEMVFQRFNLSREVVYLLKGLGFNPKYTKRGSYYVVYFKESDKIVDMLAFIGAVKCSFMYTDEKIERDIRNNVNRIQNCDLANLGRTVATSNKQVDAIKKLFAAGKSDSLPVELLETANLRVENPEASLSELGELHNPAVSKSCVNHRLKKIIEICGES